MFRPFVGLTVMDSRALGEAAGVGEGDIVTGGKDSAALLSRLWRFDDCTTVNAIVIPMKNRERIIKRRCDVIRSS